jgi:acetylornithine deacetylase
MTQAPPPASAMDAESRAVSALVDPAELVDLAGALIRIPSFKTEETPVARFLDGFFRARGYEVDLQEIEPGRFQTIATLRGTGGGASLMLNGHTDINSLTMRWKRDPWTPSLEGDRLYGHGVQNMKGGLASIVMTAEAIRRSGVRLPGDFVVACVAGETQGGEGTHHLMERGFRTDAAVVAEPFGADHLVTVHSGIAHLAIHVYGVTGHIGHLEGTVNAVAKMTVVIDALARVRFRHAPRPTCPRSRGSTWAASWAGADRTTCWWSRRTCRTSARSWSTCTSCPARPWTASSPTSGPSSTRWPRATPS